MAKTWEWEEEEEDDDDEKTSTCDDCKIREGRNRLALLSRLGNLEAKVGEKLHSALLQWAGSRKSAL